MSGPFAETSVLLDLLTKAPRWASRPIFQPDAAALEGHTIINGVEYAELSIRYSGRADLGRDIAALGAIFAAIPREALFLAGKAWRLDRAAGGLISQGRRS